MNKKNKLSWLISGALCAAVVAPASALTPVIDGANLAVNTENAAANTANAVVNALTAAKMHVVMDELKRANDQLNNMGGDQTTYYQDLRQFWENNTSHLENNTNYLTENNYHCNNGASPSLAGEGEGGGGGGMVCYPAEGDVGGEIPTTYGAGDFYAYDDAKDEKKEKLNTETYMERSRTASLQGIASEDNQRLKALMDGNQVQAKALQLQAEGFADDAARLERLRKESTVSMGSRMQASYANQLAAAQMGEAMNMRALLLADQQAQLVRAQEAAAHDARQSAAANRLRPDISLDAVSLQSW